MCMSMSKQGRARFCSAKFFNDQISRELTQQGFKMSSPRVLRRAQIVILLCAMGVACTRRHATIASLNQDNGGNARHPTRRHEPSSAWANDKLASLRGSSRSGCMGRKIFRGFSRCNSSQTYNAVTGAEPAKAFVPNPQNGELHGDNGRFLSRSLLSLKPGKSKSSVEPEYLFLRFGSCQCFKRIGAVSLVSRDCNFTLDDFQKFPWVKNV